MHYHHFLYKKLTLCRQRHSFIWAFLSNGPCEPTLPSAALFVDHSNDGQIVDTFCDALLEEEGISHHLHWRQFCWVETPPLESCHKNRKKINTPLERFRPLDNFKVELFTTFHHHPHRWSLWLNGICHKPNKN